MFDGHSGALSRRAAQGTDDAGRAASTPIVALTANNQHGHVKLTASNLSADPALKAAAAAARKNGLGISELGQIFVFAIIGALSTTSAATDKTRAASALLLSCQASIATPPRLRQTTSNQLK
jgi:hypothetical protein